jgi:hypothetical protein
MTKCAWWVFRYKMAHRSLIEASPFYPDFNAMDKLNNIVQVVVLSEDERAHETGKGSETIYFKAKVRTQEVELSLTHSPAHHLSTHHHHHHHQSNNSNNNNNNNNHRPLRTHYRH